VITKWDVGTRFLVAESLREAEINYVHEVTPLPQSHEEVIGLNVSMNEVLGVNVLDACQLQNNMIMIVLTETNHLIGQ
jgi:hypothetical protein